MRLLVVLLVVGIALVGFAPTVAAADDKEASGSPTGASATTTSSDPGQSSCRPTCQIG